VLSVENKAACRLCQSHWAASQAAAGMLGKAALPIPSPHFQLRESTHPKANSTFWKGCGNLVLFDPIKHIDVFVFQT
jgi:hypothetical protein